jgi:hypothetical protein
MVYSSYLQMVYSSYLGEGIKEAKEPDDLEWFETMYDSAWRREARLRRSAMNV